MARHRPRGADMPRRRAHADALSARRVQATTTILHTREPRRRSERPRLRAPQGRDIHRASNPRWHHHRRDRHTAANMPTHSPHTRGRTNTAPTHPRPHPHPASACARRARWTYVNSSSLSTPMRSGFAHHPSARSTPADHVGKPPRRDMPNIRPATSSPPAQPYT